MAGKSPTRIRVKSTLTTKYQNALLRTRARVSVAFHLLLRRETVVTDCKRSKSELREERQKQPHMGVPFVRVHTCHCHGYIGRV
jgi:Mg2+/Co2+ transporter CorC